MTARRNRQPTTPSRAGRGHLTRDRILEAALQIADREGLPALTMRRLGADLGVAPMALYVHVRSKEDLLAGLSDRIADELEVPRDGGDDWAAQLRVVARSMLRVMRSHRRILELFMTMQPMAPGGNMRVAEGVFRILRGAGFRDQSVTRAFFTLMAYTFGFAALEGPRGGVGTPEERAEAERQRRLAFESLPLPEYRSIVELAPRIATVAGEEQFDYGLDRLVEGLRAELGGAFG
jgi:TetR/AcrR family tetracycline transcriptional repressor